MSLQGDRGERELEIGCRVTVQGLVAAAQHNGSEGELVRFDTDKGRWGVRLDKSGEILGVKPVNLVYLRGPANIADEEDDGGLGVMKRKFDRVVKKYQLFSDEKSGEIADLLTNAEAGQTIAPSEFAAKYGMQLDEAVAFLAWIQQGVHFKETAIDPHSKATEKMNS